MNKFLIGTSNAGKFAEYKKILTDLGFKLEFVNPKDLNIPEPAVTGDSYEENALLKARYYNEKSGLPSLVDDGGFEVEALDRAPGVKSHRWLGEKATDDDLINAIIDRLKDVPDNRRGCSLNLVAAIATPFGVFTAHGDVKGVVAKQASEKREAGYPYRSLMYFPNYKKYYIELDEKEHEILNHRRLAIHKIKDIIAEVAKENK